MRRILASAVLAVSVAACGSTATQPTSDPLPSPLAAQEQPEATPSPVVADPARIRIPSIGVDAKLMPLGLAKDGSMETPDFGRAGWYAEGPRPGEDGPAVIAAHVDSKSGPDVFAKLKNLSKGAKIQVTDKAGKVYEFVAGRREQTAKTSLPVKAIWGDTDGPALRLITCGGAFDRAAGSYLSNVVVFADAAPGA